MEKIEEYEEQEFLLNDHFYDFVQDWSKKYYFLVGGYGSSKSFHIATKLVVKALEEKRKILVVREVYDTIRDSCFDLLKEVCMRMGLVENRDYTPTKSPMGITFPNGSSFIFKGMDKPEKMKSINGVSIIWIEECSEVKHEGIKELRGRLRNNDVSNHIIFSTNPVSKGNWCYKDFFKYKNEDNEEITILDDEELYEKRIIVTDNTYYHHSTVDDNYFVPQEYIETLDDLKNSDPDLWRIARKGRFGVNGTLVFPQFEVKPHNEVMEAIKKCNNVMLKCGMDFGFVTSYNALLRLAINHDNKILYIYYEYYTKGKTDNQIAEDIKEFKETRELIKADCAEPKAIKYYKQEGFRMKACKKFQGSRSTYTKKVKRFNKIICSNACPNTIGELQDLTFKVDKNGEIIEDEFNIDPHTLNHITWRSKIAV
jgi:phage terminase large subunit